ncbi:MAG: hypothetical protein KAW09_07380, partial [Thermoplasmata archaeon]|nr:hypothetical protein [Thermoplasmata archaeon]
MLEIEYPKNPDECSERIENKELDMKHEIEDLETTISDHYKGLDGIEKQLTKTDEELIGLAERIEESVNALGIRSNTSFEPADVSKVLGEVQKIQKEKGLEEGAINKIKIDAMDIQSMFEKDNFAKFHEYGFKNYGKKRIDQFIENVAENFDEEGSMFRSYISRLSQKGSLIPILDALNLVFKTYLGKHFHFDIESEKVHQAEIKRVDLFEEFIEFEY